MERAARFVAVAMGAAIPLSAAAAQDVPAREEFAVSGRTPEVCTISDGRFRASELDNFVDTAGDTLQVVQLLDPQTLAVRSARATIAFSAVCNFPHRVRLESQENGLWPLTGPISPGGSGFTSALPYVADLDWADQSRSLQMDAKIRRSRLVQAEVDQPAAGDLVIALRIDAGASNTQYGAPVLAGAYSDTLRIFLEPK